MSIVTSARRLLLLTVVATTALAVTAPSPVWAGSPTPPPPDSSSGNVGIHGWAEDTMESPAGRCRYGVTVGNQYRNHLARVGTDAPVVFARAGRASQRVAWQLVVQEWDDEADRWQLTKRSDWVFRMATPEAAAMFTPRTLLLDDAFESTDTHRAKVQLRWYARDGVSVAGRATIFPHWYQGREGKAEFPLADDCGGTTG